MAEVVLSILGPLVEKLASSAVEEIQLKQTKEAAVRLWPSKLRDFCYDAEDVLDEFEARALCKEIVSKCGGNPMALRTLGSLLYSKKENRSDWEQVIDGETWQLPNDTLTSLRISYDLMPSYLKQRFAYCSIFLKNREFIYPDDVIQLWISNGFIQSGGNNQELEEIGRQYLEGLSD
ncbi:putative disease resistance protein RGA4 [Rhodamnia argentea]|uniref:Disease resistance protein RGA4 n=1 Tax=Rhodamnia argentea TaxID=178133 RepID=A0A8B8MPL7_9MYRT|nr:putative disease resistance protein RGA4 [Rhodamnia argentea]